MFLDYLVSDITSIGCHTNLWDFQKNKYHYWVKQEGIEEKFAPVYLLYGNFPVKKIKEYTAGGMDCMIVLLR